MNIRDFMDLNKLQQIQDSFSNATGLAAISVDDKGEYITEGSNIFLPLRSYGLFHRHYDW